MNAKDRFAVSMGHIELKVTRFCCTVAPVTTNALNVIKVRSSHSIVSYGSVYILRLTGHTHDRESPIQNFSTAPKKLGAHISRPVWPPKPTEFVTYLVNERCDAFTALKSAQSERNESFLAGSDNFQRVCSAI